MELDVYEQVAQMFLVGIPNKKCIPDVINLIKDYSIGGVLIYRNNFSDLKELEKLINKLYKANSKNNLPLFIAIDEEGGRVNRLPFEFKNIPSAFKMSSKDNDTIKNTYNLLNENLHNMGFNMNLAPVLDLKNFEDGHCIGDRAFSSSPKRISEIVDIFLDVSKKNNILSVSKHFPGQGSVKTDSHMFLPRISSYQKDIVPFKHIIKNGCDALLVAHLLVRGKTGIYPASLSRKFIQKELREKLKYNGLVVTDELRMKSVSLLYGSKRSVKLAMLAGNDILCCKYHNRNIEKYIKMGAKLVEKGKLDPRPSYQRIKDIKKKYKLKDEAFYQNINVDEYNKRIEKLIS